MGSECQASRHCLIVGHLRDRRLSAHGLAKLLHSSINSLEADVGDELSSAPAFFLGQMPISEVSQNLRGLSVLSDFGKKTAKPFPSFGK